MLPWTMTSATASALPTALVAEHTYLPSSFTEIPRNCKMPPKTLMYWGM